MSNSTKVRKKLEKFSDIRFTKQELLTLLKTTKPLSEIKSYLNKKYYMPHENKITLAFLRAYIRDHNITRPTSIKTIYKAQDTPRLAHKQRLALYNQGFNDREISEKLNTHESVINIWRREYNLPSQTQITSQKIKTLYNQGKTDKEISSTFGISDKGIVSWRTRHGLPSQTQITSQKIKTLYKKGKTDKEISSNIESSAKDIVSWRARRGLPPNELKTPSRISTLYNQGLYDAEIAKIINRTPSTVLLWRRANNLKSNYQLECQNQQKIIEPLHKKGDSASKISKDTGIEIGKVYRIIRNIKKEKS